MMESNARLIIFKLHKHNSDIIMMESNARLIIFRLHKHNSDIIMMESNASQISLKDGFKTWASLRINRSTRTMSTLDLVVASWPACPGEEYLQFFIYFFLISEPFLRKKRYLHHGSHKLKIYILYSKYVKFSCGSDGTKLKKIDLLKVGQTANFLRQCQKS